MANNKSIWGEMYPEDEIARIESEQEINDKKEISLKETRAKITSRLEPIFNAIYAKNFAINKSKDLLDAQAKALSLRQEVNESISKHTHMLSKVRSKNRFLEQEKFLFYSIGFSVKMTSDKAKKIMIDGNLRENIRQSEMLESHVDFLRETSKTLESYQYSIKNAISLLSYLGNNS